MSETSSSSVQWMVPPLGETMEGTWRITSGGLSWLCVGEKMFGYAFPFNKS